jgi:hypothetical protein
MGEKFVNYQVKHNSQHDVAQVVKTITGNQAYVSPETNGWITIYDQTSEEFNPEYIYTFVQQLSKKISTTVFTFVVFRGLHFIYLLYDCGERIDEFYDDPEGDTFGYEYANEFVINRFKGDPNKLLKYCSADTNLQKISEFLELCRQRNTDYLGQDAVFEFALLLDIDVNKATIGFSYFEDNNLYSGTELYIEDADDFLLVQTYR